MKPFVLTQQNIDAFLESLRTEGKSNATIAEYRRNLNRLYQIAEKNDQMLNREVLAEWKQKQIDQEIAAGTVTNRIVKINHFLRYLKLDVLCFPNGRRQNLTGRKFGNLIVLEPVKQKAADRSICWRCRCMSCGKEKIIPANQLNRGCQVSCGCDRASRLQKTNGYIEGTCLKNVFSDKVSKNNTSGYKGVFQKRGKWAASIQYKKKNYYLGSYDRLEDAVAVRKEAENWVRIDAEKLLKKLEETAK